MSTKFALGLLSATMLSAGGFATANAAAFGPATAGLAGTGAPTVTGTTITLSHPAVIFSTTGSLTVASGTGAGSGTFGYSTTVGHTVNTSVNNLLQFNDGSGGFFDFDMTSATTLSYTNNPGVQTTIGLYLAGTMFDTNLGESATNTSFTLTFNSTGGSAFSYSGSLSNPPTPLPPSPPGTVPEPATAAILGVALAGLGMVRRRKR